MVRMGAPVRNDCTPFFYIEAAQCPPQTSDPPLTPQTFSGRGAKPQWLTQSQPHAVAAPVRPRKHAQTAAGCGTRANGATGRAAALAASCAAHHTRCGRTDGGEKGAPGKHVQAVQVGQGVNLLGMASNGGASSCALDTSCILACNSLSTRRRGLRAPHIHFPHTSVSARMLTDDLLLVLHLCIFMRADCCR